MRIDKIDSSSISSLENFLPCAFSFFSVFHIHTLPNIYLDNIRHRHSLSYTHNQPLLLSNNIKESLL